MIETDLKIYLASKSPRRKKLLEQINLKFEVITVEVDETQKPGEKPVNMVKRLAKEKLTAAKEIINEGIILTADTTVVLDQKVLGKPEDEKDALKILKKLSGRTHIVYTGFALCNTKLDKEIISYEKTLVTFYKLSEDEILDYIKTGSPMDKAGAYGIQDDFGAVFVKKINGDYYNVVGLPLAKVYQSIKKIID
jgi:septum formation protein